jgi:hypothetical protein
MGHRTKAMFGRRPRARRLGAKLAEAKSVSGPQIAFGAGAAWFFGVSFHPTHRPSIPASIS